MRRLIGGGALSRKYGECENLSNAVGKASFPSYINRELKQTTTTTVTRTSPNKRFNEQNNTKLCICVINLCTFLCRPLQNKDVK